MSGVFPTELADAIVEIDIPKQAGHGDFMTNFALVNAKTAGLNPRQLAESLRDALLENKAVFSAVEVAGPGFLNVRLQPSFLHGFLDQVNSEGTRFAFGDRTSGQKINVEFVSVNPNGPITIGSGRGAAYGSTLCNVLEAAGNQVHREYYINDGVNSEQMRLFAESVKAIIEGRDVPENGYKGDYVQDVAAKIEPKPGADTLWFQQASQTLMLEKQNEDLSAFQVEFDTWFSEQSLHNNGEVENQVDHLVKNGLADKNATRTELKMGKGGEIKEVSQVEQELQGTLWLRSTKFGDDMDRPLKRSDGRLTYIASDVAYHKDKFNRPPHADRLITVLGPDHHGYIARLQAVVAADLFDEVQPDQNDAPLDEFEQKIFASVDERNRCAAALAEAKKRLEVQIFQIVRFLKDGKPAPMRKRDGNIYALIDLIKEIGAQLKPEGSEAEKQQAGSDVARFFYLMRHHDTAMDFDLELATKQSDENPVFYVQYAHARIQSVIEKAKEAGLEPAKEIQGHLLTTPHETALSLKVLDFPNEVQRTAEDYSVNRLANYAIELARTYHGFYDNCRVIQPEQKALSESRLAVCKATQIALKSTLDLLGVSAPERM